MLKAYELCQRIPELHPPYPQNKWKSRLSGKTPLILLAMHGDEAVGLKVGYPEEDYFYSWIGGVLPEWRRMGIAEQLAEKQEEMVRALGIGTIRMKTQNRFKGMLHFALGNGFHIIGVEHPEGQTVSSHSKILLEKKI